MFGVLLLSTSVWPRPYRPFFPFFPHPALPFCSLMGPTYFPGSSGQKYSRFPGVLDPRARGPEDPGGPHSLRRCSGEVVKCPMQVRGHVKRLHGSACSPACVCMQIRMISHAVVVSKNPPRFTFWCVAWSCLSRIMVARLFIHSVNINFFI